MKISQKEGENALLQLPIYLNFQLVSKKNDSKAKNLLRNCPSSNARCGHLLSVTYLVTDMTLAVEDTYPKVDVAADVKGGV